MRNPSSSLLRGSGIYVTSAEVIAEEGGQVIGHHVVNVSVRNKKAKVSAR